MTIKPSLISGSTANSLQPVTSRKRIIGGMHFFHKSMLERRATLLNLELNSCKMVISLRLTLETHREF